jgi:hypothetical protein
MKKSLQYTIPHYYNDRGKIVVRSFVDCLTLEVPVKYDDEFISAFEERLANYNDANLALEKIKGCDIFLQEYFQSEIKKEIERGQKCNHPIEKCVAVSHDSDVDFIYTNVYCFYCYNCGTNVSHHGVIGDYTNYVKLHNSTPETSVPLLLSPHQTLSFYLDIECPVKYEHELLSEFQERVSQYREALTVVQIIKENEDRVIKPYCNLYPVMVRYH